MSGAKKNDKSDASGSGSSQAKNKLMSLPVIGSGIGFAALMVFIIQNSEQAEVTWLFFEAASPLWLVIVISGLIAIAIERLVALAWRRRKKP
jgi:uncharacterized integral membrane protein